MSLVLAASAVQWACVDEARTETAVAHARDSSLTHDLLLAGYDSAAIFPSGRYFGAPTPVARTEMQSSGALADADGGTGPSATSAAKTIAAAPSAGKKDASAPSAAKTDAAAPEPSAESYIGPSCASPAADDQQRCLDGYLARSDVKLDRSYQALISQLKSEAGKKSGAEPATVQRLRTTQRNWLAYRSDECRKRTAASEGPLWAPVRGRCMEAYSALREREFADALSQRKATAARSAPAKPKATKRTRRAKSKRHSRGWG